MKADKSHRGRGISRRSFMTHTAVGAAALAMPNIVRAQTGGRVLVRTSGGSYQEALQQGTWNEFTKITGIEVIGVPANTGKLLTMAEAGSQELDIVEANAIAMLTLQDRGVLEEIDYSRFEYTDVNDVSTVEPTYLSYCAFAEAICYNTEAFPDGGPANWADVWDVENFPGRRMLQDAKAISPNLEFALLAAGVSKEELYPLDVDRAFDMLRQIRPHVIKFFDSGALGASLLAERTAVLGALWTNRVEALRKEGAPVAIEWNQAMRVTEYTGILKGSPNYDNAMRLIDYSSSPKAQALSLPQIGLSPENIRAFDHIAPEVAAILPTSPVLKDKGFEQSAAWWIANRDDIARRWEEFLLE
ncbi:ABC transporter substrate-binding protein [Mesorhizobium sp. Z1-4]|uniref:ABC transporter substrate-binding protein n=1 Tax=Mesorhizobium sp. Z1-4 TaxID=2448478 RepID=UPI000FD97CC9|nr:ABC transporter substrate-binding protein [Mesorhizobium sp. Z1-4]